MRFRILFTIGDDLVALGDTNIDRAIDFARRISEGGWWAVVDTFDADEEVVASSEVQGRRQQ